MFKRITFLWTVWKIAAKRLGPVGGAVAAVLAVLGFGVLKRVLRDRKPGVADDLERAA